MLTQMTDSSQKAIFSGLLDACRGGRFPILVSGAGEVHKAHLASFVHKKEKRPILLITADVAEANRLGRDIEAFTGEAVRYLTNRELRLYPAIGMSRTMEQERISTLYAMQCGAAPIVIANAAAIQQRCIPPAMLKQAAETIQRGASTDPQALIDRLIQAGYQRTEQVESPGQFALRGGILDVFSPAHERPIRAEFWGDEIDSMAHFDPESQRRTQEIEKALILPTAETLPSLHPEGTAGAISALKDLHSRVLRRKKAPEGLAAQIEADIESLETGRGLSSADRYMALFYKEFASPLDYLAKNAIILCSELGRLVDRGKSYIAEQREEILAVLESGKMDGNLADFSRPFPEVFSDLTHCPTIVMEHLTGTSHGLQFSPGALVSLLAKQLPSYGGSMETAESDIRHYVLAKYQTLVLCSEPERAKKLAERLSDTGIGVSLALSPTEDLPEPGTCMVAVGSLSAGMEYPTAKLAVITEGQMLHVSTRPKKRRSSRMGSKIASYTDLTPGDLVVHEHHGVGRFVGTIQMDVDGLKKDYIKIAYHGTDSLYVPAMQLDLVTKYIGSGGEDKAVRLSKMGGADWTRARSKAKGAAKELAHELIQLYAERQRQRGHAFAPDSAWQREFEDAFEYTETDDQLSCIAEIKNDMEKAIPMDRLLCGDVGYGKTEVALRAVMKCVLDGKQAAILVPTTVLAQQHYTTIVRRFTGYPVRIEVLSRFQTAGQAKKIEDAAAKGQVDIIVGTHKLLQKRIKFKNLGLLIVDEEQRFGVSHKERLKEMAKDVDVLTLSATPIPRTLNMALSGIRDMSTIEQPPRNRQPIQTYVMEHDWGVIAEAIRRELARGGQVYYLKNRVDGLTRTAVRIQEMVEGARVAVGHGQMDEQSLSSAMENMISGESQVLVCTTIIESGIDIPNVNTLIIEGADNLGLAQLHQIRGRVGRSNRSAFAYLTYRPDKVLSELATKRLSAIREFVEFNSGFKIALRDLEIRGAGNVLGREQSGHLMSVGYDMYLKLLNEAVLEEKGETPPPRVECTADLAVDANIPERYVTEPAQRMDLYRRIAHIRSEEDAEDVIDELLDRYGEPPKSVMTLIQVAKLRGIAAAAGVTEISQKGGHLQLSFVAETFSLERISSVYQLPGFQTRVKILAGEKPAIRLKLLAENPVMNQAEAFIKAYAVNA